MPAVVVIAGRAPGLILKPVTNAAGVIKRKPLFIPAGRETKVSPELAAIQRPPEIGKEVFKKAEIEKASGIIGEKHRVALEDIRLEDTGKGP